MSTQLSYNPPTEELRSRMVALPRSIWNVIDGIATRSREEGQEQANHNSVLFCLVMLALQALDQVADEDAAEANAASEELPLTVIDVNPQDSVDVIIAEDTKIRQLDEQRGKKAAKKVYE